MTEGDNERVTCSRSVESSKPESHTATVVQITAKSYSSYKEVSAPRRLLVCRCVLCPCFWLEALQRKVGLSVYVTQDGRGRQGTQISEGPSTAVSNFAIKLLLTSWRNHFDSSAFFEIGIPPKKIDTFLHRCELNICIFRIIMQMSNVRLIFRTTSLKFHQHLIFVR